MCLALDFLLSPLRRVEVGSINSFTQVLRLQYQKELAQSHVTVQSKFNFAWGLVKSPKREHQVEGVRLLQGMCRSFCRPLPISFLAFFAEIYRAEPSRRRECLYYLALGHFKMGNFEEAKKFNGKILFTQSNVLLKPPFYLQDF